MGRTTHSGMVVLLSSMTAALLGHPHTKGGSRLLLGVISVTLALFLYTYSVFNARRHGLQLRHLATFGTGLAADIWGTSRMIFANPHPQWASPHAWIGIAGVLGMGYHFYLALRAAVSGRAGSANRIFHRVSLIIYTLWVIAWLSGAALGMATAMRGHP